MSEIKAIASYYAGRIFLWKWLSRSPDCILQNLVISYFTKNDTQWRKHCTMLTLKVFLPLSCTIDMRNSKETNLGNHRNHVTFLKELRLDFLHDTYISMSGGWSSFYTSDFFQQDSTTNMINLCFDNWWQPQIQSQLCTVKIIFPTPIWICIMS